MKKYYKSILEILFLIFISLFFAILLKESFPALIIYEEPWKGEIKLNYDDNGCSQIIEQPLILNESTVKEGEKLVFYIYYSNVSLGCSARAGVDQEELVGLKEGKNKIALFYYKHERNSFYLQLCKSVKNLKVSGDFKVKIERPSFIDSFPGIIVSFFGFFLLFSQTWINIKKLWKPYPSKLKKS